MTNDGGIKAGAAAHGLMNYATSNNISLNHYNEPAVDAIFVSKNEKDICRILALFFIVYIPSLLGARKKKSRRILSSPKESDRKQLEDSEFACQKQTACKLQDSVITAAHRHSQPQRSHWCVSSLLERKRISDEGGVGHRNSHSLDKTQQRLFANGKGLLQPFPFASILGHPVPGYSCYLSDVIIPFFLLLNDKNNVKTLEKISHELTPDHQRRPSGVANRTNAQGLALAGPRAKQIYKSIDVF
ncbi:hypothetical protein EVAR_79236_1 [Eumeta japonica]|uniref:Uncharacterized protein n=1 Tax=Eumeta variegata TaxID=151549 RepID=A0A4C1ZAG4_EUMVA|nr:hypothetical protein EVAR_79236_1 [Eumeta japonica]